MKFIELLEEYNILTAPREHHHTTSGWIQFDCPFCGKDTHSWHMGYNIQGGFVNCWRCGGHSVYKTIQEITDLPYGKIKTILENLEDIVEQPIQRENIRNLNIPHCISNLKDAHIRYLSKRGFHYKTLEQLWQVKGIGIAGRLKWRLFIPIIHQSRIVSWTTRSLNDKTKRRYISAEKNEELIPHKNILYGSDYTRHSVIIVEGPLDVWTIGPGAVATFGTAYTKQQVNQLLKYSRRVVCYDNEIEAQKQAMKLCDELGPFDGETINVQLDSKDPNTAKRSELKRLRKFLE